MKWPKSVNHKTAHNFLFEFGIFVFGLVLLGVLLHVILFFFRSSFWPVSNHWTICFERCIIRRIKCPHQKSTVDRNKKRMFCNESSTTVQYARYVFGLPKTGPIRLQHFAFEMGIFCC